jgi:ElaA protein
VQQYGAAVVHDRPLDDVPPRVLYKILQLRSQVFVVEQECVFLDPDGRDLDPACRQLWVEGDDGEVAAAARVLPDGDAQRIGRIVTAASARGQGLGRRLVEHVLATDPGPWVLDAQSHLADWYRTMGFDVAGDEYLDDGIPHVPMRRDS